MTCQGEGTPTVVLEAGPEHERRHLRRPRRRARRHDAGSAGPTAPGSAAVPALAADAPDPWPGSSADALAAELEDRGEAAPYVVLGWSYGGMVAQAFATRHADLTAGVVLEDSSVPEQFTDPAWDDIAWVDGGREVDEDTAVAELSAVDLGDLPVVVLTAEDLTGKLRRAVGGVPRAADRLVQRRGPRARRGGRPRDPRVDAGPGGGGRRRRRRGGPRRGAAGAVRRAVRRPRRPLPLVGRRVPSIEHEGRAHRPRAASPR